MSVAAVHGAATVAIAMEVELGDRVVALNDQADVAGVEQRLARPAKERTGTATGTEPEREVKVAQTGKVSRLAAIAVVGGAGIEPATPGL